MKIIVLIFMICFGCCGLNSQNPAPNLLSPSGGGGAGTGFTLTWSLGEPATETFSSSQFILTQGFQQPFSTYHLSGVMHYLNATATPMYQSTAYLQPLGPTPADSALSTTEGAFYFFHAQSGSYLTNGRTDLAWGGSNAADALLILKHFVHLSLLTGMFEDAGDVNLSGSLNSLDALLVARRFVGSISSFLLADWLFSKDTVTVANIPVVHDISALCAGDVNGTHLPVVKSDQGVSLIRKGVLKPSQRNEWLIPLTADHDMIASAISLVITLPPALQHLTDIKMNTTEGTLVWKMSAEQLRIAWYSLVPVIFYTGDPVIILQLKLPDQEEKIASSPLPETGPESEFSDENGSPLPGIVLRFPFILGKEIPEDLFIDCCYPNPSIETTRLTYHIGTAGELFISICDLPGRLLEEHLLKHNNAGTYEYLLNTKKFPPGYYIIHTTLTTPANTVSSSAKILVVQ